LYTFSYSSDIQVLGVKAALGSNIVQLLNGKLDGTWASLKTGGKTKVDDCTHKIKLENIVDPQIRHIMVLVYESIIEAEKATPHRRRG
jgi:hypothetical protein